MRTLEVSEETYQRIKDQIGEEDLKEINSFNDMVGEKYFFRTVTYHLTGKVKKVIGNILELQDAAWIADSGRFMQCIKDGKVSEVEPVGKAYINMQAVTDFFPWKHKLPTEQK